MFYRDLDTKTQIDAGPHVRAIGWLSLTHPFPRGDVPAAGLSKLDAFAKAWGASTSACGWPVALGWHTCDFCGTFRASGNLGVPASDLLYVCPEMVAHYVRAHAYRPPDDFIAALLAAPLPGTAEYAAAVARFPRTGNQMNR